MRSDPAATTALTSVVGMISMRSAAAPPPSPSRSARSRSWAGDSSPDA